MERISKVFFTFFLLFTGVNAANECIVCHKGIEDIRDRNSSMMQEILKIAQDAGHKGNDCIVCHGGNPKSKSFKYAHKGTIKYFKTHKGPKAYYPLPASARVNKNTCGMCHESQVNSQLNSIMKSEHGRIDGHLWNFGVYDKERKLGVFPTTNPNDKNARVGSKTYREYMQKLVESEPSAFPKSIEPIPKAPTLDEIHKDVSQSAYTYIREACVKCHTGNKYKFNYANNRGVGCASCHIPYSKDSFYEGNDKSIYKEESGHLLTHQIQSSRKVKVKIKTQEYSGIFVETCLSCHSDEKSIALSYKGLVKLNSSTSATKRYLHLKADIHFQKGMLCQDCHTSNDMHGDGFLSANSLGSVEIECQDCHGTTSKYPWELPLGFSDEFNIKRSTKSRGVSSSVAEYLKQGYVAKKEDGYLLSARGNPMSKIVKSGNEVIVHLSSGKDIKLLPLKLLKEKKKLSQEALLAMDTIDAHTKKLECYTCHSAWAPQFFGGSLSIDYSGDRLYPDYVSATKNKNIYSKSYSTHNLKNYLIEGKVNLSKGYMRWESPALGQNAEGRVSLVVPDKQRTITIIGKKKEKLLSNYRYTTQEGLALTSMHALQPHTTTKEALSCESCHSSKESYGFGTELFSKYKTTLGEKILGMEKKTKIKQLGKPEYEVIYPQYDYTKFLEENATLLMSFGHHFSLSNALSPAQLEKIDRRGVCISCHITLPDEDLAVSLVSHVAKFAKIEVDKKTHSKILAKSLQISAWTQFVGFIILLLFIVIIIYKLFFKKETANPRNEGWK